MDANSKVPGRNGLRPADDYDIYNVHFPPLLGYLSPLLS